MIDLVFIEEKEKNGYFLCRCKINGFKPTKEQSIIEFLCSQIEKINEIKISFHSDHENYIKSLVFESYEALEKDIAFPFRGAEYISITGIIGNEIIIVINDIRKGVLGITTESKEIEKEFFRKISFGFFNKE